MLKGALVAAVLLLIGRIALCQEVLVPLDNSGELMQISVELERELALFPEYEDFREARLYSSSDTSFILEISYGLADQVVRERQPMTLDEVTELRNRISQYIEEQNPHSLLDQSGRARLLGGMLTLSVGYYGWAVPVAIEANTGSGAALYMFTAGSGYFIPFFTTNNTHVTQAEATLTLYGGYRGILHGIAFSRILKADGDDNGDDADERHAIGSGLVFSVMEAVAGYQIASSTNMTEGTASLIGLGGDIGMGWGFGTGYLMDKWHEDTESEAWVPVLIGSGAGMATGAYLAKYMRYSRGDVSVLRVASVLGALLPISILDASDPDDKLDKEIAIAGMAGSVAGAVLGHQFVRSQHFTVEQGRIISLGTIAGGLFGLGVVSGSDTHESGTYWLAGTIGASCGFLITNLATNQQSKLKQRASSDNLDLSINPIGLADAMRSDWKDSRRAAAPLITARLRF